MTLNQREHEAARICAALVEKYGAVTPEHAEGSFWLAPDGTIVGSGAHVYDAQDGLEGAGIALGERRVIRGFLECADNVYFRGLSERGFVRFGTGDYGEGLLFFVEVPKQGATAAQRRTMGRLYLLHGRGQVETMFSIGEDAIDRWTDLLRALDAGARD